MPPTKTPELESIGQATADQLARYIQLKADQLPEILEARMNNGYLIISRRTKAGRFVRRTYDQFGECIKVEAFENWNETANIPFNPIKFDE